MTYRRVTCISIGLSSMCSLLLLQPGCGVSITETPKKISAELKQVIDQPLDFVEPGHPLIDAPLGEVRDEITSIVGCWGRVGGDLDTGRAPEVKLLSEVLKFRSNGTLWTEEMWEYQPGSDSFELNVGNRGLYLHKARYEVLNANTIAIFYLGQGDGEILTGLVTPDETILPDPVGYFSASLNIGNSWQIGITVEGDYLRTDDAFIDYDENGNELPPQGNYRYWRRLSCGD